MSLLARIKADQLAARKANNAVAKDLLTTLIGEVENESRKPGAPLADIVAVTMVKSFLKKNLEFQALSKVTETTEALKREQQILESYLPSQLGEDALLKILEDEFHTAAQPSKGLIMKFLKDNYANQYDGKLAAQVVDAFLNTIKE